MPQPPLTNEGPSPLIYLPPPRANGHLCFSFACFFFFAFACFVLLLSWIACLLSLRVIFFCLLVGFGCCYYYHYYRYFVGPPPKKDLNSVALLSRLDTNHGHSLVYLEFRAVFLHSLSHLFDLVVHAAFSAVTHCRAH